MRLRLACLLGAAIGLVGINTSQAQIVTQADGPYVRLEGGGNFLPGLTAHGSDSSLTFSQDHNVGPIVGGAFGWKIGPWHLEDDVDYRSNDINSLHVGSPGFFPHSLAGGNGTGGSVWSISDIFQATYDLPFWLGPFVPYVGGGIGFSAVKLDNLSVGSTSLANDTDLVFAFQPVAGLRYNFTENWSLGLEYRFLDAINPTFKDGTGHNFTTDNYRAHSILLSVTYSFGAPPPPPPPAPAAAPPPPPPVAPAPVAKQVFIVFFDFDKATLTPAGRQVVDAAVAAFKSDPSTHLQLTGYTDLAGTQAYNLKLSQRRAQTVAAYMEKAGVPASALDVEWRGKENPRVPTPDGVREPQNRRVEIDFR